MSWKDCKWRFPKKIGRCGRWNDIMTKYLPTVAKGNLISKIEQWAENNNIRIRSEKQVRWTAEEEAQVRAFADRSSVTPVGKWTLAQTKSKYDTLKASDKKKKEGN